MLFAFRVLGCLQTYMPYRGTYVGLRISRTLETITPVIHQPSLLKSSKLSSAHAGTPFPSFYAVQVTPKAY
jgi:hypothetical protein